MKKNTLSDLLQRHLASKLLSGKTLNPLKRWRFANLIPGTKAFGAGHQTGLEPPTGIAASRLARAARANHALTQM